MSETNVSDAVHFPPVPAWIDDLVIYEIATKGFT